ncbi:MAG: glycosyltransferase family 2 protein [Ignavibacteria bacterium]|nr:glycosyltransferase family 2 protein [Ignavibacteria bacterium]
MLDLSIIIVNYNSEQLITKCLVSIIHNIKKLSYEIIIVDNNSPGKSALTELEKKFNNIKLHFNNTNSGFGSACNIGAKFAEGKYLVFLNPDVEFIDNSLENIHNIFDNSQLNIGAISPVLIDENGKLVYTYNKFPNLRWELSEAIGAGGTCRLTTKLLKEIEIKSESEKLLSVDAFTGACICILKELFMSLEGFDEKMFLYYEDTDLQKRLMNGGYLNLLALNSKVVHLGNKSTKNIEGDNFYYYHIFRSKLIYFYKHLSFIRRNSFRLIHIWGFTLRILLLPFRKKYRNQKKTKMKFYFKLMKLYLLNFDGIKS